MMLPKMVGMKKSKGGRPGADRPGRIVLQVLGRGSLAAGKAIPVRHEDVVRQLSLTMPAAAMSHARA